MPSINLFWDSNTSELICSIHNKSSKIYRKVWLYNVDEFFENVGIALALKYYVISTLSKSFLWNPSSLLEAKLKYASGNMYWSYVIDEFCFCNICRFYYSMLCEKMKSSQWRKIKWNQLSKRSVNIYSHGLYKEQFCLTAADSQTIWI